MKSIESARVTRASFDTDPIQAVSVFHHESRLHQRFAAIGCSSHVTIVRLDSNEISDYFSLALKGGGAQAFTVTDVAWNHNDPGKLAASATNGVIATFNCETSCFGGDNPKAQFLSQKKQEWDSGTATTRSVHRICWHNVETSILASANQDGCIRIFDVRDSVPAITLKRPQDTVRDLHFDPFNDSLVASITENGNVCIWDWRKPDQVVQKFVAHTNFGLSIVYNREKSGLLATGARDKNCKVWNLSTDDKTASIGLPKQPVVTLRTPSPVGRIRWRPGNSGQYHLATTAGVEKGDITVWNLLLPNMPACILRGHDDPCTDFDWLETPSALPTSTSQTSITSGTGNSTDSNQQEMEKFSGLNIWQHVLSVGKDGKLLVQDLRNGYFPRQHISPSVVAISSRGDVAFQRGVVYRSDLLDIQANEKTAAAPSWYADQPENFGMIFSNPSEEDPVTSKQLVAEKDDDRNVSKSKVPQVSMTHPNPVLSSASKSPLINDRLSVNIEKAVVSPIDSIAKAKVASSPSSTTAAAMRAAALLLTSPVKSSHHFADSSTEALLAQTASRRGLSASTSGTSLDTTVRPPPIPVSMVPNKPTSLQVSQSTGPMIAEREKQRERERNLESCVTPKVNRGYRNEIAVAVPSRISSSVSPYRHLESAMNNKEVRPMDVPTSSSLKRIGGVTLEPNSTPSPLTESVDLLSETCMNEKQLIDTTDDTTGIVHIGLATISSLESAMQIRKVWRAEGGVFDPAIIKLLAHEYSLGDSDIQYVSKGCSGIVCAIEGCRNNLDISRRAGLNCRAAVWTTLLALLPTPETHEMTTAMGRSGTTTLPFTVDILGELLVDLLELGDTQHFVVTCEILRSASNWLLNTCLASAAISPTRRLEAYYCYLNLLQRLQLFNAANSILLKTDIASSPALDKGGLLMYISCSSCGKEVPERQTQSWCDKCSRCVGLCFLCHKPVRGLFQWCPVCGHGGHNSCTKLWFQSHSTCATGCGHACTQALDPTRRLDICQPVKPKHSRVKCARRKLISSS